MGFTGQYLADQLKDRGWKVSGTCTNEEKRKKLEEKGYEAFILKAGVIMEELIALDTIIKQQKLSRSQKTRGSKLYTSRIHVADICQAILASIELPSPGKIYNIVDDDAASRAEVFSFAKSLLEEKWPCKQWKAIEKGTPTGNTEGEASGYRIIAEKRVSNRRLKDELKVKMLYPSYMQGLKSIIESIDSCPF